jgi:F-type H+-transporting ATPase subunit delta
MNVPPKQLARLFVESVENASPKHLEEAATELVKWLHARGELKKLKEVIRSINQIWKEKHGLSMLTIETAHPLTKTMKEMVVKMAAGAEIKEIIDPTLIGGAKIRIDERIMDGSLKGALEQLTVSLSK